MHKPKHLRILVADDEEFNLLILMKNMIDHGYHAKGFGGGLPAWEYLEKHPNSVDIVILDKLMDDMCGVEIVKRMKNHPTLKKIPVMIQSGCVDSREAIAAGVDRYLAKPYTNKDIIAVVAELAASKNLHNTLN